MAANILPEPGSDRMCADEKCGHTDCQGFRRTAVEICQFCGEPIGYCVRYYNDPERSGKLVHAKCLEIDAEKMRKFQACEHTHKWRGVMKSSNLGIDDPESCMTFEQRPDGPLHVCPECGAGRLVNHPTWIPGILILDS